MADQPEFKPGSVTMLVQRPGRIFELRVNVTGFLPGSLEDWPAHIQDPIYAAMERLLKITRVKRVDILRSLCGRDVDTEPYYVIVTVQETTKPEQVNGWPNTPGPQSRN